jgi:hypothetical protein
VIALDPIAQSPAVETAVVTSRSSLVLLGATAICRNPATVIAGEERELVIETER